MTSFEDARTALAEFDRTPNELPHKAQAAYDCVTMLRALIAEHERLTADGSCWDEGPILRVPDGECAPPPPLCELRAGHAGAHRGGRAEWMTKEPLSAPPTDDEREALVEDRKAVLGVLNAGRSLPLDVVSAQVVMVLADRGFRRQGPITDAMVEASAERFWLAGHPCEAWPPSNDEPDFLAERYRTAARAALEAAERAR